MEKTIKHERDSISIIYEAIIQTICQIEGFAFNELEAKKNAKRKYYNPSIFTWLSTGNITKANVILNDIINKSDCSYSAIFFEKTKAFVSIKSLNGCFIIPASLNSLVPLSENCKIAWGKLKESSENKNHTQEIGQNRVTSNKPIVKNNRLNNNNLRQINTEKDLYNAYLKYYRIEQKLKQKTA